MEITLEQVERLREKAAVSYGQAKAALEYSGGNLLDALIYLEERGVIPRPEDAYYSTKGRRRRPPTAGSALPVEPAAGKKRRRSRLRRLMRRLRSILLDNELEIWRREQAHHCHPHAAADRHSDLFLLDRPAAHASGAVLRLPISGHRPRPGGRRPERRHGFGGGHRRRCGPAGDG
ncbi:MAG: hypothetical protein ACLUJG_18830 [Lawsonibacter sp.]